MGEQIKRLRAKVTDKHETEANWNLSNYVPDVGETVFYDVDETHDYVRQKNGDGKTLVRDLPFTITEKDLMGASEFDIVITSEEEFKKCAYMLHPNKNADGSVDLTTKGQPNPDFDYRYILVRGVDFTENLGSSDLNLAVLQPSIRYIKFDNCQWHCQWWISGEEPTELKPIPSGTPTEYKPANGPLNVILDGIYISEQNVIDSIPTKDDPDRYYCVGLRNFERIENCFIHYPSDYALVEELADDGITIEYRYSFKFNLQYFNTTQNCKVTALWDGANISGCRISERIVRCNNCTNITAEPIYKGGELYRVQMRESKNLSNIYGSPIIYTSCKAIDADTCSGYEAPKEIAVDEFDLIITHYTELKALPDNTTATSVLVAIPAKLGHSGRVPGFFDNDISNEAYYSKLVIPKNVKYIKFAKCFSHDCPRVIIQGHEECIIDGLPTIAAPYNYTNCQVLYNFKEVRNCHAVTNILQVPLSGVNLKDFSTLVSGTISTNKYLENNTEYKLSFDLELVNSYLSGFVYISDYTDSILLTGIGTNGHYEVTFSTNKSDASTVKFNVDAYVVDSSLKGSLKITNVKVERADSKLTYANRINAVGNVLLGTPAIAKYPQLAPDREEQKTKFVNCDLGIINGASVIENCNIHFYGGIVDANNVQTDQSFTNVKRISGITVSHSKQNKVKFDSCSNISSVNHGDCTITYTNCTKIDTQSCDNAPTDPIFATKQELTNYATTSYVDNKIKEYKPNLSDYATEKYVDDAVANAGKIKDVIAASNSGLKVTTNEGVAAIDWDDEIVFVFDGGGVEEEFIAKYSEGLAFTSNGDGTCSVSGIGTCPDVDLRIPLTSMEGDKVTSIGSYAFYSCDSLTSVEIGDSVTSIGDDAFEDCNNLTSVVIGNSVTNIGASAFYNCSKLANITYSSTVKQWNSISFGAFWKYNIQATHVQCTDGTVAL